MTIISPSLLSCDFLNIESQLKLFDNIPNIWLHLDIMDGHFVPNLTFGNPIIKMISSKTSVPLDAHFMVTNPEFYIESLKNIPIHNFTIHLEASKNILQDLSNIKKNFKSCGISIKPNTPVSDLSLEILKIVDLVLVMSVEPGFGGQGFIESSYDKLKELSALRQKLNLNFMIQIDGGVSNLNSQKIIATGADNLVAGSFVFAKGDSEVVNQIQLLRP